MRSSYHTNKRTQHSDVDVSSTFKSEYGIGIHNIKKSHKHVRSMEEKPEIYQADKYRQADNSIDDGFATSNSLKTAKETPILVGIIDCSQAYGQITPKQWQTIEDRLLQKIEAIVEAAQLAPSYCGKEWKFGHKIVKCKNKYSLDWLCRVIPKLSNLWPEAQLKVVPRSELEFVPAGEVHIDRDIDAEVALKILQTKNPDLPTADWKILQKDKINSPNGGFYMTLRINRQSERLLAARGGRMFWTSGTVKMHLIQRK